MGSSRRALAGLAGLVILIGACSSGSKPEGVATPPSTIESSAPDGTTTGPAVVGTGTKAPATRKGGGTTNRVAPIPPPPRIKVVTGYEPSTLYTAAENTIGFLNDKIVLCVHAALSLKDVFNVSERSLNTYWAYVNDELGGIYGREVVISYADDKYGAQPGDAPAAYETCKAKKPFILLGGIGFDQIPQVRTLAEEDHQLYIHHIAREDATKKYAFSYLPSVETIGRLAGEWILKQHAGKKVGILSRDSEHWEPGRRTFKAALAKGGVTPVDVVAQKNAAVYTTQIRALSDANAKVVFIWENALSAIEIIRQAQDQGFEPQWVVFPFNLMSDTLGADTTTPIPIEGIATWAPYLPGTQNPATKAYEPGKVDGAFARYKAAIKEFERQHAKYASGENRDDIVFMTWAGWAQIHKLLLQCGKDCTRNKVVGLLASGAHTVADPGCPIDFTKSNVGSNKVQMFRAFRNAADQKYGWTEIAHCASSF